MGGKGFQAMMRSFKYRLWTNASQERELSSLLETHRRLYNLCLEFRQMAWDCNGITLTYIDLAKWFSHQGRKSSPWFARLNVDSARLTIRRLERAFEGFFRRIKAGQKPGYPRFRGKDRFDGFSFADRGARLLPNGRLLVPGAGQVRIKLHRPVEGRIKTVTLKQEDGKWFVVFACELPDVPLAETGRPPAGIDMGLESFLTTSDSRQEPNPRFLKDALPDLRRKARAVARKKKGGKSRKKAVRQLRKAHARVREARRDHHHKTALGLTRRYGFIAAEGLNIQGMVKSRRLARAIMDAGWGGFLNILRCKAEGAGIRYVEVDPRGTSQTCSGCQAEVRKELKDRWHLCPGCGLMIHRDHNAALNVLARGLASASPARPNVGQKAARVLRSRSRKATE